MSAHKKPLAEEDADTIREDYVRRMRDNYPLIVRTLMNDIIASVDKDGNLIFVNDATVEFLGKSSEELIGTNFIEYLHPEDVTKAMSVFQDMVGSTEQVKGFIFRVKSPKGLKTVAMNGVAVFDDEGNYIGAQVVGKDLTDLLRTEEELKWSKKHFRRLFEVIVDPIVIVDMKGNILEVSQSAKNILGFPKEELIGKNFMETDAVTDESKALITKNLGQLKKGKSISPHTIRAVTDDGKHLLYEVTPARIMYRAQPAILAIFRNITEQKKAEEKLRASEERFRSLIDNAPEAIWLQDASGTFVDGNKRAEELTGYKKDELIGKNMLEANMFPDKSLSLILESWATIQIGERSEQKELELIRKDGSLVSVESSAIPIERDGKIEIIGIAKDITERKKMEEALRASEERFRGTLDSMLEGCQIIDYNWRYVYVNDSAAKHGRLPKKELIGKTMMEMYPEIEKTKLFSVLSKCMKERVPAQMETEFTYPNGKKAWFELSIEPIPEGLFILSIDISDRKEVEEALRREREMLEIVTSNINAGLIVVSKDYLVLWTNNVLRKSVGDIEGKPCYAVLNQQKDVCHGCGVKEVFETGQDWVVNEQVIQTPDGQEIWLLITATAIRDENGEIVAASEMSLDITERKKTELALKESEEKFRTIFEGASDGIAAIDPATMKLVFANPALVEILGFPMDKLIGSTILDYIPKEEIAATMEKFQNGVSGKRNVFRDLTVLRQDNTRIYVDITSKFLTFGNQRYLISFVRDVTEQKRTQEAISEANRLLKQSNKDLESYTYVVSHDLKAPLRTIRSFGSFLLEDYENKLNETGRDYLNRMINASSRMDNMIEDLLILSRVGRKFTEIKKVDLNKLIKEILSDLEATIKEQKTKVVVNKLPVLSAQKVWMRQLFMNLISNALKFNESKSPKIEVLYQETDDGHLFKVRDNGIGIEEKYLERIFKLFERAPTKKKYEGTGAGLSICKKIVEHLGGKIWVESTPGKGSTFIFTIPREPKKLRGTRK